jgi:hypothetical protein
MAREYGLPEANPKLEDDGINLKIITFMYFLSAKLSKI